jgi:carboxymethylenebutenolidase
LCTRPPLVLRSNERVDPRHRLGEIGGGTRISSARVHPRSDRRRAVVEQEIRIKIRGGTMKTFIAHPDSGPFPVVLVYMDALGIREDLYAVARRIAAAGYYAVLPDLFCRSGDGICFDASKFGDPASGEMDRMVAQIQTLNDEMIMSDTGAILEHVGSDSAAASDGKGCMGFCMGARYVIRSMGAFPDEFVAGSALHPSFIVTDAPDSPHLDAKNFRGAIYVGWGEVDQISPVAMVPPLREELERNDVPFEIDVYPGADHGFMFPGLPAYQKDAAERSWERTLDLFGRSLQRTAVASG